MTKDMADSSAPMCCSDADGPHLPHNAARSDDAWVSVGDWIEAKLVTRPGVLRAHLTTPEACAYGNELIAQGNWKKVSVTEGT